MSLALDVVKPLSTRYRSCGATAAHRPCAGALVRKTQTFVLLAFGDVQEGCLEALSSCGDVQERVLFRQQAQKVSLFGNEPLQGACSRVICSVLWEKA